MCNYSITVVIEGVDATISHTDSATVVDWLQLNVSTFSMPALI